jgi:bifunctional non-homologous end joining protein LigD
LHSGKHNEEVQLCAFDVLAMAGDDLRAIPLSMRKANLARLLARRPDGIFISDFEEGEIGPDLFPSRLPNGIGRFGIETTGSSISVRPVKALGEGEEPKASGDEAGDGFVRMIENHRDRFNHKEPSTSTDASPRI